MKVLSTSKGIGGQLTAFRELVKRSESIIFVGSPGFCTPFAELLAYGLRGSGKAMMFIPNTDVKNARSIIAAPQGMQLGDSVVPEGDTIVLLGGLAMPRIGSTPGEVKAFLDNLPSGSRKKLVIGVCFQSIFEKEGWTDIIGFDHIIDSDLENCLKSDAM
ncbi:DUF2124 family protein [Methanomethylovorans sp.]|uniref:DUF2124 family protein n=1 Tax=Methanomethylovorans sp. TaxID=2758717 RepID=UPI003D0E7C30